MYTQFSVRFRHTDQCSHLVLTEELMEISPAAELAHITYPLLADVASEEVEMKERLQFLVNLLRQYLHSLQGEGEKERDLSSRPKELT